MNLINRVSNRLGLPTQSNKHRRLPRFVKEWATLGTAQRNLRHGIQPVVYGGSAGMGQQPQVIPDADVIDCMFACGATLLRAWARLLDLGETENPNPKTPPAQVVRLMREHADQLDTDGTPDLSAHQWQADVYACDEHGQHVWGTDRLWTWQDRLEAARRFQQRHGVRYGFNAQG